jgi:hypothetical protein
LSSTRLTAPALNSALKLRRCLLCLVSASMEHLYLLRKVSTKSDQSHDALPGIKINTSPTDFFPIEQERLARFDGERWVRFGELIDARASTMVRN